MHRSFCWFCPAAAHIVFCTSVVVCRGLLLLSLSTLLFCDFCFFFFFFFCLGNIVASVLGGM